MKITTQPVVVKVSSNPAIVLVDRPMVQQTASQRIAAMNRRMNAGDERLGRMFEANTRRLTGKPNL